ncbi:hypothetical protein [Flavobacterium pallidum]|uniref:Uncharacterized protein n=1 Tax=Flavobacterium pallidum TaxID=2172098 RepID=A0A2S1SKB6_9FLAO|nr:hypothetical protein [Flavobacterium pallidum]AWI26811.1 hypothetical protein HYN49_13390 [Flavobacterium pallidum]
MNPIFEHKPETGIGYCKEDFLNNFLHICEKHKNQKRAKSFALILYDFHNKALRNLIKDFGAFIKLDRLSGKDISVFYLDSENQSSIATFNYIFSNAFEVDENTKKPFVIFFNVKDDDVKDVNIIELEQSNLLLAFQELHSTFENYLMCLNDKNAESMKPKFLKIVSKVGSISLDKLMGILLEVGAKKLGIDI